MGREYKVLTIVWIGFLSFVFVECNRMRGVEGSTTDNSVCGNNANTVVFFMQQLTDVKSQLQSQVQQMAQLQKIEAEVNASKISTQTGASIITTEVDNVKMSLQHLNFSLNGHELSISNFDSRLNNVETQFSSMNDLKNQLMQANVRLTSVEQREAQLLQRESLLMQMLNKLNKTVQMFQHPPATVNQNTLHAESTRHQLSPSPPIQNPTESSSPHQISGSTTAQPVFGNNANTAVFFMQQINDVNAQLQSQAKEIERLRNVESELNALKNSTSKLKLEYERLANTANGNKIANMEKSIQNLSISLNDHNQEINDMNISLGQEIEDMNKNLGNEVAKFELGIKEMNKSVENTISTLPDVNSIKTNLSSLQNTFILSETEMANDISTLKNNLLLLSTDVKKENNVCSSNMSNLDSRLYRLEHQFTSNTRLVNGNRRGTGRVEFLYQGSWGTVCDDHFTSKSAQVVCRSLGFPWQGAIAMSRAFFGQGSGNVNLFNVDCTGSERAIADCPRHPSLAGNHCGHNEDVGVICSADKLSVRLADGTSSMNGRVEVLVDGQWGRICDYYWDNNDAKVVCRMLGYSGAAEARKGFGGGRGKVWMSGFTCTGDESTLNHCYHYDSYLHTSTCSHNNDAWVVCHP